jgi:para-nitrobenzyl esterase
MIKKIILSILLIICIAVVLFYQIKLKPKHHVYKPDPITERMTQSGGVVGFIEDNGSHAWFGIPYAKAPVGELRWRAPLAPDKWEGTLEAVELRPICPQYGGIMGDMGPLDYNKPAGDEDCLFLNIWSPAFSRDTIPQGKDGLPVLLWIHGGGNSIGHGGSYNGRVLAEMYDVIVITFNYRLGPLGWFSHPALREESATAEDGSGNYGTLDVIRALGWIKENISAFGGDAGNVTVFGESAGGRNALTMVLSPKADGLFHRAISQSGAPSTTTISKAENYSDDEESGHRSSSREIVNKLLVADNIVKDRAEATAYQNEMTNHEIAEYLRSKSAKELVGSYEPGPAGMMSFPQVFRDGTVLPKGDPFDSFRDPSRHNAVPTILGTNRDEYKLFMAMDPEYVQFMRGVKDQEYYDLVAGYLSDSWKASGADEIAVALNNTGREDVYVYRFDWDEEPNFLGGEMSKMIGAAHAVEIPFVFNNFENLMLGFGTYYSDDDSPGRKALAKSMSSYWAEFAYRGSPGKGRHGGEPEWKHWDNRPGSDKFIIFDTVEDGGIRMSSDVVRWTDLKQRLLAERTLSSQEKHCEMYVWMFGDTEEWNDEEYENLGEAGCRDYPRETLEW